MQYYITRPYSNTAQTSAVGTIMGNLESFMLSKDHVTYNSTDNKCPEACWCREAESDSSACEALWDAENIRLFELRL